LSARKKRWVVRDPAPADFLASQRGVAPVVATLLYQRGLRDPAAVAEFLTPDYRSGLHDPFLLKGMDVAARRVADAIAKGEPIAVYGDFDTDGVTAVTLLMQAITAMGGDIRPYIPHRLSEGYGLNVEAIDRLIAEGVRLLITVDCGISNLREVAHAQSRGLDVIVTDHHTPPVELPQAHAVVNPKQPGCPYPFKQLVGVGIAYKLVQALVRLGLKMPLRGRDLLDVVALGTVTDMGPLVGENRVLVKNGLDSINSTQRPGLRALIVAAGLLQGKVTSTDISFMLGPRLNAAGRLDDAILAYKLLLADDYQEAQRLAEELNSANRRRQELTKETQIAARRHISELGKQDNRIIMLDGAGYPAGLVGLVAAKLVEELGRPVAGLEQAKANGHDLRSIHSVASFFVSRVDTEIDKRLDEIGSDEAKALRGKAALANAWIAYGAFEKTFQGERWEALKADGANAQRPLWASTGVKDPSYSPTLYVDQLVVADVVNTMPEKTLQAVADAGKIVGDTVTGRAAEGQEVFDQLAAVGIDLQDVFVVLETEGVEKFEKSWEELLETVTNQLAQLKG
jgi:single-stranded-DNA-specific exonuclease